MSKELAGLVQTQPFTLVEAIGIYLTEAKTKGKNPQTHLELQRFAQWCGASRPIAQIAPSVIGEYSERMMAGGAAPQAAERLQVVRDFLFHLQKKGRVEQNLAQHVRIRKVKSRASSPTAEASIQTFDEITFEGHTQLTKELERLKNESALLAEEIHRAAQDKDVRENAPLEAAREQKGHVESRIRDLEGKLKNTRVIDASTRKQDSVIRVGSRIMLKDVDSGEEKHYTLVSAAEANPLQGKISDVSPVGRAVVRRAAGQQVEVETPRGTQHYLIVKVTS
jgi:transcription elongation factor GreA